jgi:hypothetical protein
MSPFDDALRCAFGELNRQLMALFVKNKQKNGDLMSA